MSMDLSRLSEPFPSDDIEWRVSRADRWDDGSISCKVLAYITARAIQERLDEVCGPGNWQMPEPKTVAVNGKSAFVVGISIRINGEWVTKWDVAEPTAETGSVSAPAKGGYSGAMKRAGAQWGIGRYLYNLEETKVEVSTTALKDSRQWNPARLPKDKGGVRYFWKTPTLPEWALPKGEQGITEEEFNAFKKAWISRFAPDVKSNNEKREGFKRFVASVVGEFPCETFTHWTRDALDKCQRELDRPPGPAGIDPSIPFA